MKYITILNLLFKLLFTLSIFLVVKEKMIIYGNQF